MLRRVDTVLTDVSEERIASIFRVEEKKKSTSEPACAGKTGLILFYPEDGGDTFL
jgi:hypothetical protein